MAANARMAITVAPSRGIAVCLTTSMAACLASSPFCRRTSTPSTTTMALSTSMPRAMIRAPSEMRSRATPMGARKMKLPAMVNSNTKPISRPLRSPMNNSSTTMTMATACIRLTRKPRMAVLTASDCTETRPKSMPTGIWALSSLARCFSASPMVTTLPPDTVEIPRPIAGLPS